jgi:hypothetical protein
VLRLHRLPHHAYQVLAQSVQVRLVAQPSGEGLERLIALCSDIGPLLLRSSSVGVSGVSNPPAQCLKQASRGWSNFIDYRSSGVVPAPVEAAVYDVLDTTPQRTEQGGDGEGRSHDREVDPWPVRMRKAPWSSTTLPRYTNASVTVSEP